MDVTCDDLRHFVGGQVQIKRFRPRRDVIAKLAYVGQFRNFPGGRQVSVLRLAWMVQLDHESGQWRPIRRRHYPLVISGYNGRLMDGDMVLSPGSIAGQVMFVSPKRAIFDFRHKKLLDGEFAA